VSPTLRTECVVARDVDRAKSALSGQMSEPKAAVRLGATSSLAFSRLTRRTAIYQPLTATALLPLTRITLAKKPKAIVTTLPHIGAKFPHPTAQLPAQQSPQCRRVGVAYLARNCLDVVANRNEMPCPFDSQVLEECQR
jgi:hypothetical protein